MRTFKRLVAIFVVCLVLVSLIGCKGQARQSFVGNNTIHLDEKDNIKGLVVYTNKEIVDLQIAYGEVEKQYFLNTRYLGSSKIDEFDIFIYYRGDSCSVLVETNDQEFYIFNATIVVKKGK